MKIGAALASNLMPPSSQADDPTKDPKLKDFDKNKDGIISKAEKREYERAKAAAERAERREMTGAGMLEKLQGNIRDAQGA
ncbi:hypothetical protein [Epibacterium ulvae]|uniref:EF-hand domain-containing protein n=1 Tax=Epibacterium ulvae TaxID=1156985 RepID=A0A1G5PVT9_9RHOB|nr:hypothetical protein [Epibacterium ulvae]SCZ53623.1 hypothetical protein SAMN04488118_102164 [Epibacterium ulvae]